MTPLTQEQILRLVERLDIPDCGCPLEYLDCGCKRKEEEYLAEESASDPLFAATRALTGGGDAAGGR